MQIGASFSSARRLDPPFHYALIDAIRWIGFWGLAAAILVSAMRSVGVDRKTLAKSSAILALVIFMSSLPLAWAGRWLGESRDWRDARSIGTAMAMDGFVKAHPDSRHVLEARRLTWEKVVANPDLARVSLYLEHAKDWGDRIDSARLLERKAIVSLRRRAKETQFSEIAYVDSFWRSKVPDPDRPGSGSRIVGFRVVFEPTDFRGDSRNLSRDFGFRVFVPDSSFDPFEVPGRNRLVEDMLDSAVRGWANTSVLTIAPWKMTDSVAPDLLVRLRARLGGPLEFVPCAPGCPPEKERWTIPALVYSWSVEMPGRAGEMHRTGGEVVDTAWTVLPDEGENDPSPHAWFEGMDMERAWAVRAKHSLTMLPGSLRERWGVRN